jgi:hypothetical protein
LTQSNIFHELPELIYLKVFSSQIPKHSFLNPISITMNHFLNFFHLNNIANLFAVNLPGNFDFASFSDTHTTRIALTLKSQIPMWFLLFVEATKTRINASNRYKRTHMKPALLFLFLACSSLLYSQNCVDSTLINPDAICPMIYAPVCGCNGVTYDNDCLATNIGGVTSWTDGPCNTNTDCMDLSALDFGMCDMFLGYAWNGSSCIPMSGCGYTIGNIDYSPFFYTSPGECQQVCGNPSTDCINQAQIEAGFLVLCTADYNPVCGCDGNTYSNACMAFYMGGVTSFSAGECGDSSCFVIPADAQFGECAMPLGWARTVNGCVQMSGCSYISQFGFDYSPFFFESSYECLGSCSFPVEICYDPALVDSSMACIEIYDPVCGCDSITYSNSCYATYYGGVTSYTPGACLTNTIAEFHGSFTTIFPNPANELLRIVNAQPGNMTITISDYSGKTVYTDKISSASANLQLSQLTAGLYIVRISFDNGIQECHKLIIE